MYFNAVWWAGNVTGRMKIQLLKNTTGFHDLNELNTKVKRSIMWPFGCSACPGTAEVSQSRGSAGVRLCLSKWPLTDAEGKRIKIGQACRAFPGIWPGLQTTCCNGTSWAEGGIYILCLPGFTGLWSVILCKLWHFFFFKPSLLK